MMEAAPTSPFEVTEPDLLLQFMIIALDTPAQFGDVHQFAEGNVLRKRREPVFGGFLLAFGPLDQQPLFRPRLGESVVSMRGTNAHAGEARRQPLAAALAPRDLAPSAPGQAESEFFDRDRFMPVVAMEALRSSATARPFPSPTSSPT